MWQRFYNKHIIQESHVFQVMLYKESAKNLRFKQGTGKLSFTQLSELRLGNFSIRSRKLYEIKFSNYIRARSVRNVIPILWIKSDYDLVLPSHQHPCVTRIVLQKLKIGSIEYGSILILSENTVFCSTYIWCILSPCVEYTKLEIGCVINLVKCGIHFQFDELRLENSDFIHKIWFY